MIIQAIQDRTKRVREKNQRLREFRDAKMKQIEALTLDQFDDAGLNSASNLNFITP
jgi:hypothetical protein